MWKIFLNKFPVVQRLHVSGTHNEFDYKGKQVKKKNNYITQYTSMRESAFVSTLTKSVILYMRDDVKYENVKRAFKIPDIIKSQSTCHVIYIQWHNITRFCVVYVYIYYYTVLYIIIIIIAYLYEFIS